jgi:hypothetical protein
MIRPFISSEGRAMNETVDSAVLLQAHALRGLDDETAGDLLGAFAASSSIRRASCGGLAARVGLDRGDELRAGLLGREPRDPLQGAGGGGAVGRGLRLVAPRALLHLGELRLAPLELLSLPVHGGEIGLELARARLERRVAEVELALPPVGVLLDGESFLLACATISWARP